MLITRHAIARYQERIEDVPKIVAECVIIAHASLFGGREGRKMARKRRTVMMRAGKQFWLVGARGNIVSVVCHPLKPKGVMNGPYHQAES